MEERKITDQYGSELKVGDYVCFVANPDADWRQTKNLARKRIAEIKYGKNPSTKPDCYGIYWDWLILEGWEGKVTPRRVVKCY